MAYTKQVWQDSPAVTSPLSAARLNYMEDGIAAVGSLWAAYTPSLSGLTIGNGTLTGAFARFGDTVLFRADIVFGTTTAVTGNVSVGLPATAASPNFVSSAVLEDNGVSRYMGFTFGNTSTVEIYPIGTAGAYGSLSSLMSATVPFTWGSGDFIRVAGSYQAA